MKNVTGARSTAIGTYSQIARENYQNLLAIESQIQELKGKFVSPGTNDRENEFELMKLELKINKYVSIVIVFSAIAVEAYIYDYGSRNLSDTFVKNYLDKLDPVSKWIIIPRLITGKELPREHRWFDLLNKLIKQRNNIIHHKSSSPPFKFGDAVTYFQKLQQSSAETYSAAGEAIELLDILPIEMREIDSDERVWIDGYLAPYSDNPFKNLEEP